MQIPLQGEFIVNSDPGGQNESQRAPQSMLKTTGPSLNGLWLKPDFQNE
jgi:hypothetical protein